MANIQTAKKRIRQAERRTIANGARVGKIRTCIKNVESAIDGGSQSDAKEALRLLQPELMRGASRGVLPQKTASRKMSRLSKRVKEMSA